MIRNVGEAKPVTIKGFELRPALIAIDTQNGFVSDGGSYGKLAIERSYYKEALPNISMLVSTCRISGIPIIFSIAVRESSGVDLLIRTHKILPLPRQERIKEVPFVL